MNPHARMQQLTTRIRIAWAVMGVTFVLGLGGIVRLLYVLAHQYQPDPTLPVDLFAKLAKGYQQLLATAYHGKSIFHSIFQGWWTIAPAPTPQDWTANGNVYLVAMVLLFVVAFFVRDSAKSELIQWWKDQQAVEQEKRRDALRRQQDE